MIDETNPTAASLEGEPSSEPTPQPETQAAPSPPAAAPEEVPRPEWLDAPVDAGGPSAGYGPRYPQPGPPVYQQPPPNFYPQGGGGYYPPQPPPGYGPPQPRPGLTLEDLGRNPDGSIRNAAREEARQEIMAALGQTLGPALARVGQLDAFAQQQHESAVVRSFNEARKTGANEAWNTIYAKHPAFKNPTVQKLLDQKTRMYLANQVAAAANSANFTGLEVARTARPYKLILADVLDEVGWNENAGRIEMRGAFVESSRSQPQSGRSISEDEHQAAQALGLSDEEFLHQAYGDKKGGGR